MTIASSSNKASSALKRARFRTVLFNILRFALVMGRLIFRKSLIFFILTVLVNPGLLQDNLPGPSNEDSLNYSTRRTVARCTNCEFRAYTEVRESIYLRNRQVKVIHTQF